MGVVTGGDDSAVPAGCAIRMKGSYLLQRVPGHGPAFRTRVDCHLHRCLTGVPGQAAILPARHQSLPSPPRSGRRSMERRRGSPVFRRSGRSCPAVVVWLWSRRGRGQGSGAQSLDRRMRRKASAVSAVPSRWATRRRRARAGADAVGPELPGRAPCRSGDMAPGRASGWSVRRFGCPAAGDSAAAADALPGFAAVCTSRRPDGVADGGIGLMSYYFG